jgi:hypothetical protein
VGSHKEKGRTTAEAGRCRGAGNLNTLRPERSVYDKAARQARQ